MFLLRSWDTTRVRRRNVYLILDTEQTLQDDYIFAEVHLEQEEGWQLEGAIIAI